ncbi:hypothetical protein [Leucobacter sp. PH1c]|uniref:hypothetical protein n=1 Tax=Leucobacter sp. PH1c TaxID=1397278 RepID=UPI000469A75F|nr:hypothetical protein [Leucobacter sp. PH1c]
MVSVSAVAAVVLITGGAVAGQRLLPVSEPAALSPASARTEFDVEPITHDDARTVQVGITRGEDHSLSAKIEGRLTRSACAAGEPIVSGGVVAQVDDKSVLALHTTLPLWEPLEMGATGEEVNGLRQELARMGADLLPEGPVNQAVVSVVASLLAGEDATPERLTEIPSDRILWIPERSVTVLKCSARVGQTLSANDPLGVVSGTLQSVQVRALPTDLAPGARQLSIGGVSVEVDEAGSVTSAEGLAALAATPEVAASRSDPDAKGGGEAPTVTGRLALSENVEAWAVPAGAVFEVRDAAGCVLGPDGALPVQIVGSRLGKTFVVPAEAGASFPGSVRTPEAGTASCWDDEAAE